MTHPRAVLKQSTLLCRSYDAISLCLLFCRFEEEFLDSEVRGRDDGIGGHRSGQAQFGIGPILARVILNTAEVHQLDGGKERRGGWDEKD